MKKIYLFTIILIVAIFEINAQIAINKDGSAPHSSAMLDIKASGTTNAKGFLMPRVADHGVITTPAKGLMIFNTTTNSAWMYNGTAWAEMASSSAGNGWTLKNDTLYSSNKKVGINTDFPKSTLEVQGNGFLVTQKMAVTTIDPNLRVVNMPSGYFGSTTYPISSVTYTEAAGILYNPSGPSAPYPNNVMDGAITITPTNTNLIGIKLTFEAFDTEANGDSVIIYKPKSQFYSNDFEVLAKYSGNTIPPDFFYGGKSILIQFKTNGNNIVGQGFKIKWQSIDNNGVSTPITGVIGNSAYFETTKGAFRAGNQGPFTNESVGINSTAIGYANRALGNYSTALGYYSQTSASSTASFAAGYYTTATGISSIALGHYATASGPYSLAMGASSEASGYNAISIGDGSKSSGRSSIAMGYAARAGNDYSISMGLATNALGLGSTAIGYLARTTQSAQYATAMGYNTIASSTASFAAGSNSIAAGQSSTAMGSSTNASGYSSTALGENSFAGGYASTALGSNTVAGGDFSTAMGSNARANLEGSFAIGDSPNGSNSVVSPNTNTFSARFRNGYYLYSNADSNVGVVLSGGANSWSTTSDSTKKENFLPIDGENVLKKIANIRTVTWNYKGQDPKHFRHYGPMAQEFFSAFGRDKLGVIGNDTTIASADFDGVNFTAIKALEKRTAELQTENENLKKRLAILEKSSSEIMVLKAEMEQLKALLLPEKEKISTKVVSEK